MEFIRKTTLIHECYICFALLPYPGCPHHCPENSDEGFYEQSYYMEHFVSWLKRNINHCLIVRVPNPEDE